MNEKLAALKVYCVWAGIEVRNLGLKMDYPLYEELKINEEAQACSWCEMVGQGKGAVNELLCKKCPLWKADCCCNHSSLYAQWRLCAFGFAPTKHNTAVMQRTAGDIAAIAWKEYKRLGG